MPDDTAQQEPVEQEQETLATGEDALGDAGKKALDAMKRERRAAEKRAADLEQRLKEFEDRDKTEQQKAADRAQAAEQQAAEARSALTRLQVALRHGIAEEDLDLLGTGTEEQIEARAERIAALKAASTTAAAPAPLPLTQRPAERMRPGALPNHAAPTDPRTADLLQIEADLQQHRRRP